MRREDPEFVNAFFNRALNEVKAVPLDRLMYANVTNDLRSLGLRAKDEKTEMEDNRINTEVFLRKPVVTDPPASIYTRLDRGATKSFTD